MNNIITKLKNFSEIKLIYFSSMLFFILLSFFNCVRTHGAALYDMLVPNYNNHYWDLFTSIYYNYEKIPYQEGVVYPPGANLICWIMSKFFSTDLYAQGVNPMRDNQIGMIIMLWFILASMLVLLSLICKDYNKGNAIEKILFIITLLFSAPFIREVSKLNIIPLSIIFTYIFLLYKDDKNTYVRILSLLCLAGAVSIKIYPVFFGLYLIKEKKWKDTIACVIFGILVFFLPFAFFGGIGGLRLMLENILSTTSIFTDSGLGFKINISNTIYILGELLQFDTGITQTIGTITNYSMLLGAIFSFFFLHSKWKALAILSLITLSYPSFSNSYAVLFMIPALISFFNEEKELTYGNIFYTYLFVALFAPMFFGGQDIFPSLGGVTRVNLFTFVESIAIFLMQASLIIEGFIHFCIWIKKKFTSNTENVSLNT